MILSNHITDHILCRLVISFFFLYIADDPPSVATGSPQRGRPHSGGGETSNEGSRMRSGGAGMSLFWRKIISSCTAPLRSSALYVGCRLSVHCEKGVEKGIDMLPLPHSFTTHVPDSRAMVIAY